MLNRKAAGVILSLSLAAFTLAADMPTTKPAIKLVKPWDDVTNLTDDQRSKIDDIHKKSLEDMKMIRDKEKSDIMALLTDDQKADLKKNHEADTADMKMKKADKAKDAEK